jgi:hypothetical protein
MYYRSTRYAYFILQAESLGSIELAQSGLMLATYEHASGLIEQAYTTIWSCARMMHSLRLQEICQTKMNCDDYDQTECAEAHSLWWAILIPGQVSASLGYTLPINIAICQVGRISCHD